MIVMRESITRKVCTTVTYAAKLCISNKKLPLLLKYKKHATYISQFLTGQLILQAFGLLNGFFLLRWLSVSEQAKFSVAFSIQNLILSLSDLGFTGSIVALVGPRVNDKKVVGAYIHSAKRLRNYLFFFGLGVTLFILPAIIKKQAWSMIDLAIILTPVLLAVFWQANCSLYDSTLVMHRRMQDLYKPQIAVAMAKLALNYILNFAGIISAFSTLSLNAAGYLANGTTYKKKAAPYVIMPQKNDNKAFKEIINYLKPLFPSLIFNALYGQVQILIISFFGHTNNIAEIAALGRLSQIFMLLGSINGTIIAPLIARTEPKELAKRYMSIIFLSLVASAGIYYFSLLAPQAFLFLLGSKYYHLKSELSIMILNACLSYLGGVLWTMHSARKWIFWWGTWLYMICVVSCQIAGVLLYDISTTHGVLQISTLTLSCMLLVHAFTSYIGFTKLKKERLSLPDNS